MRKNIIPIIPAVILMSFLFASCGSVRQGTAFSERKYYHFPHHNPVVVFDKKKNAAHSSVAVMPVKEQKQVAIGESPDLQAATDMQTLTVTNNKVKRHHANIGVAPVTAKGGVSTIPANTETVSAYSPADEMVTSEHSSGGSSGLSTVALVIIAIFVAPLAVYLYDNAATTRFIIILILWLLAFGAFGFYFLGLAWLVATIWAILIVTGSA